MEKKQWGGKREGAVRKKTGKNIVQFTLTLKKDEAEILKARASEENLTISGFISKYLFLK